MELIYIGISGLYFQISALTSFKDVSRGCDITIYSQQYLVQESCDNYLKNNIKVIKVGK